MMVNGHEQPAFAPLGAIDALEAYAPFLYPDMAAADADQKGDVEQLATDREDEGDDEADNFYEEDVLMACVVEENGTIQTDFNTFTRASIFAAFGETDPAAPAPRL